MNPSPLFSAYGYYKNYNFNRLIRNWTTFQESNESNVELRKEWETCLISDFYDGAKSWLWENRAGDQEWRKGLE